MRWPQPQDGVGRRGDVEQRDPPARAHGAAQLVEEHPEVDQVAQGEAAGHPVERGVRERQAEDVRLRPGRAAAVGVQHPEGQVDRQRAQVLAGQLDAQVAGAGGQVGHHGAGRQLQRPDGQPSPADVEAERS